MVKTWILLAALGLLLAGCEEGPQRQPSRTPVDSPTAWVPENSPEWKNDPFWKPTRHSKTVSALSTASIADLVRPSVVVVQAGSSYGTGFVVGQDLVVTNLHVVEGQDSIKVQFIGGSFRVVTSIAAFDKAWDLVVLVVKTGMTKSLVLGNSEALKVGEPVVAVGNPKGLALSVSDGIVSALRPIGSETIIQTTAPISPGSSGGPLVSSRGVVIGVTSRTMVDGQALNFAIPSSILRPLVSRAEVMSNITTVEFANLTRPTPKQPEPKPSPVSSRVPESFPAGLFGIWWGESIASVSHKYTCHTLRPKKQGVDSAVLCDEVDGFLLFKQGKLETILQVVTRDGYTECQQSILRMVGPSGRSENKDHDEFWSAVYSKNNVYVGQVTCSAEYADGRALYTVSFTKL